jgi:hypothetical protein
MMNVSDVDDVDLGVRRRLIVMLLRSRGAGPIHFSQKRNFL